MISSRGVHPILFCLVLLMFTMCDKPATERTGMKPGGFYHNKVSGSWDSTTWSGFHSLAVEEALTAIRPGIPGKAPFWNGHAKRFIHVPSFDFKEVEQALGYKFIAVSDVDNSYHTFETDRPWALLTPVWKDIPVGLVHLSVEAIDENGLTGILAGERTFYRAAAFNGPYKLPVSDYGTSVITNMESLLQQDHYSSWRTESLPSEEYRLYCYPSKTIGSIIRAMCMYASLSEPDRDDALIIARNAASYLLSISMPEGTVLEFFPPTYLERTNTTHIARERKDQLMMFYPAVVGSSYLDLYDMSSDRQYLDAALRIATTYVNTQLAEGSWPLMVWKENGEAVEKNLCVPTPIIQFLERIGHQYGYTDFLSSSEKAFQWIMDRPMKDFHWEGQFEDVGYSRQYSNMERGKPLAFASLLLDRSEDKPEYLAMAEELIRFAEDQFIVWEQPLPREMFRTSDISIPHSCYQTTWWFTPCVLEQYGYYTPIDASAASAIAAFQKAYEFTGKELYLAKALCLADNQTFVQELTGGIYPTYQRGMPDSQRYKDGVWQGWLNCATITSGAMLNLHELLVSMNK